MAETMSQAPGSLASGSQLLESNEIMLTKEYLTKPHFDYTLTVVDYLPSALADAFISAIAEYVWLPWKQVMAEILLSQDASSQALAATSQDTLGPFILGDVSAKQDDWMSEHLPGKFTDKLLKATKHISMHIGTSDGHEDHQFPIRAGSYLSKTDLGTPALAFVKSICHLYALDRKQSHAVTTLRRQLLKMIHVKEFSPEALWKDPCASLIIQDIICPSCQDCQDIDLCRDPSLQEGDVRCQLCGMQRDIEVLEMKLMSILQNTVDAYLLQDVKCKKCGATGAQHVQRQCDICGGHMDTTTTPEDALNTVRVIKRVSEIQNMHTVESLCHQVINSQ